MKRRCTRYSPCTQATATESARESVSSRNRSASGARIRLASSSSCQYDSADSGRLFGTANQNRGGR